MTGRLPDRGEGTATRRNWIDPPHNRLGFIRVEDLTQTLPIPAATAPSDMPTVEDRDWDTFGVEFEGRRVSLTEFLSTTYTDALLVLRDGAIELEWYAPPMIPSDRHILMSLSKSVTSILCGILVGRGLLDPSHDVTGHVVELTGTSWDGCTIQDLLDMRTGTSWDYNRDEVDIFDVSGYRMHDRTDLPVDTASWVRSIGNSARHGGPFRYVSLVADVLAWVLERAAGRPLAELLSEQIWSRIGSEYDAAIVADSAGFPIAEGGICATLRDVGRFGQMCLQNGRTAGERIVATAWLDRLRRTNRDLVRAFALAPEFDPAAPAAFYHNNWWVRDAEAGIYAGLGVFGQTLLIHHPANAVVVKFSSQPEMENPRVGALQTAGLLALCEHTGRPAGIDGLAPRLPSGHPGVWPSSPRSFLGRPATTRR